MAYADKRPRKKTSQERRSFDPEKRRDALIRSHVPGVTDRRQAQLKIATVALEVNEGDLTQAEVDAAEVLEALGIRRREHL
jgi:hypothetical protein